MTTGPRRRNLWEVGDWVLPLAFGSAKGNNMEAAATVLLDRATRTIHGERATYLADALTTLGITDPDAPRSIEGGLTIVLETLSEPSKKALAVAYDLLVDVLRMVSARPFKPVHWSYTKRLELLRQRLQCVGGLAPGMTVHQAKGREWDVVGLRLTDAQRAVMATGLSPSEETQRQLYVACTRARDLTIEV